MGNLSFEVDGLIELDPNEVLVIDGGYNPMISLRYRLHCTQQKAAEFVSGLVDGISQGYDSAPKYEPKY